MPDLLFGASVSARVEWGRGGWKACGRHGALLVKRCKYNGESGFDLSVWWVRGFKKWEPTVGQRADVAANLRQARAQALHSGEQRR